MLGGAEGASEQGCRSSAAPLCCQHFLDVHQARAQATDEPCTQHPRPRGKGGHRQPGAEWSVSEMHAQLAACGKEQRCLWMGSMGGDVSPGTQQSPGLSSPGSRGALGTASAWSRLLGGEGNIRVRNPQRVGKSLCHTEKLIGAGPERALWGPQ